MIVEILHRKLKNNVEILHRKLKNKEHADHYNGNRCELMYLHRKVDIS
jgi:hypothetical protein